MYYVLCIIIFKIYKIYLNNIIFNFFILIIIYMDNNFLILNNKKIKYISGPVSFSILTPINNNNNFPIIILFGDIHYSSKYMCKHCNIKNNCYNLYDKIIDLFNNISNKNNMVDIYLEHDIIDLKNKPLNKKNNNKQLIPNLLYNIYNCYHTDKKYDCYYNNIRWHFADLRRIINTEYFIYDIIYKIFILIKKFNNDTFNLFIKLNNIYFNKNKYFKKIIRLIFLSFKNKKLFVDYYYKLCFNNYIIKK